MSVILAACLSRVVGYCANSGRGKAIFMKYGPLDSILIGNHPMRFLLNILASLPRYLQ